MTPARQPHQIFWKDAKPEDFKNAQLMDWIQYVGDISTQYELNFIRNFGGFWSAHYAHTSATAPEPDEIRPEVIAFAKVMEDTLRKHDGKKTHWRDVSVSFGYLFGRVSDEIREAKDEYHVHNPDYHKCVMELVDVANFCMMCYDRIHPADARSRPHTPAPSQDELAAAYERGVRESSSLKHEKAEAAKAERERENQRVLDSMKQFVDSGYYTGFAASQTERILWKIESLRAQPEPQQEERR